MACLSCIVNCEALNSQYNLFIIDIVIPFLSLFPDLLKQSISKAWMKVIFSVTKLAKTG
jgi:hypothetical protein